MRRITEALILHQNTVGEKDLLLVLLSPELGRLSALAKGARRSKRRFVNTLEPFSYIRAHLRGGKAGLPPFLDQADLLEPFEPLRLDVKRYLFASYFAELVECFFRPGTGQEAFVCLKGAWQSLASMGPSLLLKMALELRLLTLSGFAPELRRCVRCEAEVKAPFFFSPLDGGLVCLSCHREGDLRLSGAALAALRHLGRTSFETLSRVKVRREAILEAGGLLEIFLKRVLDREPNALRVLKEMF